MQHGRGIDRIMDEDERRKWQNPEAILSGIGVVSGCTFIEPGCGRGFFVLPAARMAGPAGMVYGIDINAGAIAGLKERADREGIRNLRLTVGKAEETVVCEACADIVFIGTALHDFQDASRVLEKARLMLKPGGKLVDLDWKKEPTGFGPPMRIRFDEKKAAGLIEAAGFKIESITGSGPYHYLIIARP